MKKYLNYQVTKDVVIKDLVTIETLEISLGFSYPEETHDFYEYAYVDSGSIMCNMELETVELRQGEFYLIPPFHRHSYCAVKEQPAMVFIVCFRSNSECLYILDHKIALDRDCKRIISDILSESKNAFLFPFEKILRPTPSPVFGSQQMVENNIERLLINLIRSQITQNKDIVVVMNSVELENSLCNDIIHLLKSHIFDTLSLDQISAQTHYSKTFINNIFKKNTGLPVMKYFTTLKIQEAKSLLRNDLPVETVASRLSFESPTYFTKVFKKYTNMTPTAYKKTIM